MNIFTTKMPPLTDQQSARAMEIVADYSASTEATGDCPLRTESVWFKRVCAMAETIARQESMLARLPISADGVRMLPGDRLWPLHPISLTDPEADTGDVRDDYAEVEMIAVDQDGEHIEAGDFPHNFSTFAAAEAARAKLPNGGWEP